MNEWMNDFLSRCLEGVPEGTYRNRTEQELRDHLLALSRDLEGAGYAPAEARALAQSRMGDPAALAQNYAREWRRRTLGQRVLISGLIAVELLLVGAVMVVMAYLYAINTANFGKELPAYWGFAAIPAAGLLLCGFLAKSWTLARLSSQVIAVIQLPPILCWLALGGPFEMSGMMVPGWAGFSIHLLFFLWGLANYKAADRLQLAYTPASN